MTNREKATSALVVHGVLITYCVISLWPIFMIVLNSFKNRRGIFQDPMGFPNEKTFNLDGFVRVLERSNFDVYFTNSLIVTLVTLFIVLLTGAMAAWALSEYKFPGSALLGLYLAIGIMVPIRLGTVSILELVVSLNLTNTLTALILVYTAQSLPLAILILTGFMKQIPKDLKEAARCDGVSEYRIFYAVVLPLIKPAIATVGIFTMVPVWNDLWFPLILAPSESTQTVTMGVQQFVGQYVTDWSTVLAALTLAIVPVMVLYFLLSRQLVRGITAGAVK